jgi:hypothetical protein
VAASSIGSFGQFLRGSLAKFGRLLVSNLASRFYRCCECPNSPLLGAPSHCIDPIIRHWLPFLKKKTQHEQRIETWIKFGGNASTLSSILTFPRVFRPFEGFFNSLCLGQRKCRTNNTLSENHPMLLPLASQWGPMSLLSRRDLAFPSLVVQGYHRPNPRPSHLSILRTRWIPLLRKKALRTWAMLCDRVEEIVGHLLLLSFRQ